MREKGKFKVNNLELDAMVLIEKLSNRIAEDAKTIAMLETTLDIYKKQIEEMAKQMTLMQNAQEQ